MESLFRATTEFLLIMTAVSLAAANPPSNTHSAAVSDKNETKRIAEPGGLWRSTKLTHLCSDKLTHLVHSIGKCFFFPSSRAVCFFGAMGRGRG
jgi:hypothetical protein